MQLTIKATYAKLEGRQFSLILSPLMLFKVSGSLDLSGKNRTLSFNLGYKLSDTDSENTWFTLGGL